MNFGVLWYKPLSVLMVQGRAGMQRSRALWLLLFGTRGQVSRDGWHQKVAMESGVPPNLC